MNEPLDFLGEGGRKRPIVVRAKGRSRWPLIAIGCSIMLLLFIIALPVIAVLLHHLILFIRDSAREQLRH